MAVHSSSALASLASYSDFEDSDDDDEQLHRHLSSDDSSDTPPISVQGQSPLLLPLAGHLDDDDDDDDDDGLIPAEPSEACPADLQEKIAILHRRVRDDEDFDVNAMIQRRKEFKNPSIYDKLVEFCGIDEHGSNYAPDLYDPQRWTRCLHYEDLTREQNDAMYRLHRKGKKSVDNEMASVQAGQAKFKVVYGTAKRTAGHDAKKSSVVAVGAKENGNCTLANGGDSANAWGLIGRKARLTF